MRNASTYPCVDATAGRTPARIWPAGVFTAFRRSVALELGGFTVGMNGQDGDFTLRTSRMGYRTMFDPKIIVYEDVPPSYREIRLQRVTWSCAVMHNQARHGPYRAGLATSKVWMSQTYRFVLTLHTPIRLTVPVYLLFTAIFDGTYRAEILAFLGIWIVSSVAFMAVEAVLAVGWGQARHLGWVVLWPVWPTLRDPLVDREWAEPSRPPRRPARCPTDGRCRSRHSLIECEPICTVDFRSSRLIRGPHCLLQGTHQDRPAGPARRGMPP